MWRVQCGSPKADRKRRRAKAAQGLPAFLVSKIPPTGTGVYHIAQPEIYFGEANLDWVAVNTDQPEFSGLIDTDNPNNGVYVGAGAGSVTLSNYLKKIIVATDLRDSKLVTSGVINDGLGTVALTKAEAGTWVLTQAQRYTGINTITLGTLQVNTATGGLGNATAANRIVNAIPAVCDAPAGPVSPLDLPVITGAAQLRL